MIQYTEKFINILQTLKETITVENPYKFGEQQLEKLKEYFSLDDIYFFWETLNNYAIASENTNYSENRYVLVFSEYPFNPILQHLYRINLNFMENLERPMVTLVEDYSNLPSNILNCIETDLDIVEKCLNNTFKNDSKVVGNDGKYPDNELPKNDINILKNIKMNNSIKNDYLNIPSIYQEIQEIFALSGSNVMYKEQLVEIFSEIPYKLSEFHQKSQKICKSLEKQNRLYYNGFITKKGYFIKDRNTSRILGICDSELLSGLELKVFEEKDLYKYSDILPSITKEIKYVLDHELQNIIRE